MYPYPPPTNSPEDYLTQFQRLLPRGRIWHRGWGWVQDQDLLTLMPTWARLQTALNSLIGEIFPCSTEALLPEWEDSLGLPDECTGPLASFEQRQAAVCGKFTARGGQSQEYFIRLAASLGFEIKIETYHPFTACQTAACQPVYDEKWAWVWRVISSSVPVAYFSACEWRACDPLATWGNALLECEFNRYKPSNTEIIFSYTLGNSIWDSWIPSIWDDGDSIWDQGIVVDQPN